MAGVKDFGRFQALRLISYHMSKKYCNELQFVRCIKKEEISYEESNV